MNACKDCWTLRSVTMPSTLEEIFVCPDHELPLGRSGILTFIPSELDMCCFKWLQTEVGIAEQDFPWSLHAWAYGMHFLTTSLTRSETWQDTRLKFESRYSTIILMRPFSQYMYTEDVSNYVHTCMILSCQLDSARGIKQVCTPSRLAHWPRSSQLHHDTIVSFLWNHCSAILPAL